MDRQQSGQPVDMDSDSPPVIKSPRISPATLHKSRTGHILRLEHPSSKRSPDLLAKDDVTTTDRATATERQTAQFSSEFAY
jgi:hypothetical protein